VVTLVELRHKKMELHCIRTYENNGPKQID